MQVVLTLGDVISIGLVVLLILFIVGYFMWELISTAWDLIRKDWKGK